MSQNGWTLTGTDNKVDKAYVASNRVLTKNKKFQNHENHSISGLPETVNHKSLTGNIYEGSAQNSWLQSIYWLDTLLCRFLD